jgi:hypothetical protein
MHPCESREPLRLVLFRILLVLIAEYFGCSGGSGDIFPAGDAGTGSDADLFTIDVSLSEKINTVGIVDWSVDRDPISGAVVEFGLTSDYGMEAPVDLSQPEHRTLLLGMKPLREYHFRVRAWDDHNTYLSGDYTVETGAAPNALPAVEIETAGGGQPGGGFITTSTLLEGWVFIIDADGDYVWWHQAERRQGVSRARMSYDAKRMAMIYTNNVGGEGAIEQVDMDGYNTELFPLIDATHDFVPIPGGITGYIEMNGACESIKELNPDGSTRLVCDIGDFSDGECHTNAIRYSEIDDAYTVSVLYQDTILKIDRQSGEVLWALNGDLSSFTGTDWSWQHGHQLLSDGIVVFSNGMFIGSHALEYRLDEANWQAVQIWEYRCDLDSYLFGDVQRLPNGNTLVTYSFSGVFHEVAPDENLVRKIELGVTGSIGFSIWQESLYVSP